ncbi:hypothetical protein RSAG8_05174, partial [Rhizoctonia solani AG-8 WAC10335]
MGRLCRWIEHITKNRALSEQLRVESDYLDAYSPMALWNVRYTHISTPRAAKASLPARVKSTGANRNRSGRFPDCQHQRRPPQRSSY